jgi:hypothetical protein
MYGGSNTIVGHPLDTIKTKMQAEKGSMGRTNLFGAIGNVYRQHGLLGYYKGWLPNFWGSIIFRSIQFSAFETMMTSFEHNESMRQEIPGTYGI